MAEKTQKWVRKPNGKTEFADVPAVEEVLAEVAAEPVNAAEVLVAEGDAPVSTPKPKKELKPPKPGMTRCEHCGKWINPDRHDTEEGDYCKDLHSKWSNQMLAEHRRAMSSTDVPVAVDWLTDGKPTPYVKLAFVDKLCKKAGIPISRFVKAFGGDRCLDPEKVHPRFRPVYVGNARWLHPWCATPEGLAYIVSMGGPLKGKQSEGTTKRAKKELAEALTPPEEA